MKINCNLCSNYLHITNIYIYLWGVVSYKKNDHCKKQQIITYLMILLQLVLI